MSWIRAVAAFTVSLFFPGVGHALIRDWARALLFGGLSVSAVAFLLPVDELAAAGSISELVAVVESEPWLTQLLVSTLPLFAALDAGFRALVVSSNSRAPDGPTCPHCGRELDAELEFCHWCTARLAPDEDDAVNS